MRDYPKIFVSEKAEKTLRTGHPWLYRDEVTDVDGELKNGGIADVVSHKGRYLGSGFINDRSKILVRVLSRNANDTFDDKFFIRRLQYAVDYRRTVMGPEDFRCCRLVYGDADGLPGLVADRFDDVISVQINCLGTDQRKDVILPALVDILRGMGEKISAVYERNDAPVRTLEGLDRYKGFYTGAGLPAEYPDPVQIRENGLKLLVDYVNGQKTGYFLDQKYNRRAIRGIASGRRVLDCFTHTGAFALNAAAGGASHVDAVDVSRRPLMKRLSMQV